MLDHRFVCPPLSNLRRCVIADFQERYWVPILGKFSDEASRSPERIWSPNIFNWIQICVDKKSFLFLCSLSDPTGWCSPEKQVPLRYIRCDYFIVTHCTIVFTLKNSQIRRSKIIGDRPTDRRTYRRTCPLTEMRSRILKGTKKSNPKYRKYHLQSHGRNLESWL